MGKSPERAALLSLLLVIIGASTDRDAVPQFEHAPHGPDRYMSALSDGSLVNVSLALSRILTQPSAWLPQSLSYTSAATMLSEQAADAVLSILLAPIASDMSPQTHNTSETTISSDAMVVSTDINRLRFTQQDRNDSRVLPKCAACTADFCNERTPSVGGYTSAFLHSQWAPSPAADTTDNDWAGRSNLRPDAHARNPSPPAPTATFIDDVYASVSQLAVAKGHLTAARIWNWRETARYRSLQRRNAILP
jgi:hypothetical protein